MILRVCFFSVKNYYDCFSKGLYFESTVPGDHSFHGWLDFQGKGSETVQTWHIRTPWWSRRYTKDIPGGL